jgi:hypothetical protein
MDRKRSFPRTVTHVAYRQNLQPSNKRRDILIRTDKIGEWPAIVRRTFEDGRIKLVTF